METLSLTPHKSKPFKCSDFLRFLFRIKLFKIQSKF